MPTIITENDESNWNDRTGEVYHFPLRYLQKLQPGTRVVYYKGILKKKNYRNHRLSSQPHYFGIAQVGRVYQDSQSTKNDYYCEITDFHRFSKPVHAKQDEGYLEPIPQNQGNNYWRFGVRDVSDEVFNRILSLSDISPIDSSLALNDINQGNDEALSSMEGNSVTRITTTYERDHKLREQAIRIHGLTCMACGFNFEETYGEWGVGFIHVHHTKPVAQGGQRLISARDDLVVLCANCHAMVHREKARTLSLGELRSIIGLGRRT